LKSLFTGIKVRKLSKKWLVPNLVTSSEAEPRCSEMPFSYYLQRKISLD